MVRNHEEGAAKGLLRLLTCGSVDDGKSTLIGRLLYESKQVFEDQLTALARDTKKFGTTGEEMDFALLVDGLEAEREQGITIDVAYRFFATKRRSFIVADTPGHEQYTRNMATGASTADLAVLLVDARKGLLSQTKRHSVICSLLGIRHMVLAVNKMDAVGYNRDVFERIVGAYQIFAAQLDVQSVVPVPLSARFGDNVTLRSGNMGWYAGPTLLQYLEEVEVDEESYDRPFRFPVQWINRPGADFRGYSGTVASGHVSPGDEVVVVPSGRRTVIDRIVTFDGNLAKARAGDAVTLVLRDETDVSRGDMLTSTRLPPEIADRFAAHLLWMSETSLLPGRSYLLRAGTRTVTANVTAIRHRLDIDSGQPLASKSIGLNEIAYCAISTAVPLAFDPYAKNRATGAFILIDRFSNETVAAGMIDRPLEQATNLHYQTLSVSREERAATKRQKPSVLWFTGLSGAGKSTIANLVERQLHTLGHHTMMLDGDNLRLGLNRDLGFTAADRVENIRRVGEVARLMTDAGLIVLCSFISPFRAERQQVRELFSSDGFIEIFVDTPLEVCASRDPKGLYAKAKAGQIRDFTGVDSPYELPEAPELRLEGGATPPEVLARQVLDVLRTRGVVGS